MSDPFAWISTLARVGASLVGIPTGGVRAAAQSLIAETVGFGWKPMEIVGLMRASGISYRYQNMLNDIRFYGTLAQNREALAKLPTDQTLSTSFFAERALPRDADFLTVFKVRVTNTETGVSDIEYRSMYSNTYTDADGWWEEYAETLAEMEYEAEYEHEFLGLDNVIHNQGRPYGH